MRHLIVALWASVVCFAVFDSGFAVEEPAKKAALTGPETEKRFPPLVLSLIHI